MVISGCGRGSADEQLEWKRVRDVADWVSSTGPILRDRKRKKRKRRKRRRSR